jgi:hypothetical protein
MYNDIADDTFCASKYFIEDYTKTLLDYVAENKLHQVIANDSTISGHTTLLTTPLITKTFFKTKAYNYLCLNPFRPVFIDKEGRGIIWNEKIQLFSSLPVALVSALKVDINSICWTDADFRLTIRYKKRLIRGTLNVNNNK